MNKMSEIVYGLWRLEDIDRQQVYQNLCKLKELGVNTVDTADIYHIKEFGDSERLLGEALSIDPKLKEHFKVVTKCGICIRDEQLNKGVKYYNNTYDYIVNSAKRSLENLKIDKIHLFLLHRPSVFMDFNEVYEAFKYLKDNNIVENFGVSNYSPIQFDALYTFLSKRKIELKTNQIEMNPLTVEHFDNDNIFYLKGKEIAPMIWSPMAGGDLFNENIKDEKVLNVRNKLKEIANKYDVDITNVIIAYLKGMGLNSKIILGSHKINRYETIYKNIDLKLRESEMFEILESYTGKEVL